MTSTVIDHIGEQLANGDVCRDCFEGDVVKTVRCPIDETLTVSLCQDCLDARGTGIEIVHVDEEFDVYGARGTPSLPGMEESHLNNVAHPVRGWLGNPYLHDVDIDSDDYQPPREKRLESLELYKYDLLEKIKEEPIFAYHLRKIRGKRVACYDRHSDESIEDTHPTHLDVVNAALHGLYDRDSCWC